MSKARFVLFKNKNKEHEKQPDMTGSIEDANGNKTHYLSGWFRTPKAGGDKFLSGELTSVAEQMQYKKENSTQTGKGVEFSEPSATALPREDDDLPF